MERSVVVGFAILGFAGILTQVPPWIEDPKFAPLTAGIAFVGLASVVGGALARRA